MDIQFSHVLFVEMTVLSALNFLGTLKKQLTIDVWAYFWTLHYVPLIHVSSYAHTTQSCLI